MQPQRDRRELLVMALIGYRQQIIEIERELRGPDFGARLKRVAKLAKGKRPMSEAGRKAIADAQRARWAKVRANA